MYVSTDSTACGGQMRAPDPLGLELLTVMSHHVGTRNEQDRGLKSDH